MESTTTKRIEELERRMASSDMFSERFWKRAMATFGHVLAVYATLVAATLLFVAFVGVLVE